jgi:hypothetical protein
MSFLGKLERIADVLAEGESVEKGNDFERYVVNLFDERYFSIVDWTSDISRKHDRLVESDGNPDLTVRYNYKDRNELFCVECKYRSGFYNGKLHWAKPYQMERYQRYARERGLPFFVVIGLGGKPDNPDFLFCIPLEEAKYPALYPSVLEKYERDPYKRFFWNEKYLQ